MKNYNAVIDIFPFKTYLYREENYIYFLPDDSTLGSFLLEERPDRVIVWNNELKYNDYKNMYTQLRRCVDVPMYIVYIANEKEYNSLLELGAKPVEFNEEDYPHELGSLILKAQDA